MRILKLSSAENRFFLNEDKSTQQPPRAADSVEIEETKEIESTIEFMTYRFRYEIPESRTFEAEDEVMVEISDEELIPSADTQNFVRLSYLTRGFSLTCHFPDCIEAEAHVFALSDSGNLLKSGNPAVAVLEDWCVPGHAALVQWKLPSDWRNIVTNGRGRKSQVKEEPVNKKTAEPTAPLAFSPDKPTG